ncbi:UDP-N-acetylglucosamine 2-epimerase (non-hydrolyzing) [bacterium]|nr:UDP-N-acetylglucosamine 2-epimerase (non-hydrolyzing) [bacterium]
MMKVMTVFGTRPEGIKMAPVVMKLKSEKNIQPIVVLTAQHRQMLDQVMNLFDLKADYDLDIMKDRQTLSDITVRVLTGLEKVMEESKPDVVLVQGDTTTAFAGALSAFYHKIPVGHIEAGLRTDDMYNPFPEEMNRRIVSSLASIHFAPTREAKENLLKFGVEESKIYLTGNTVVDALQYILSKDNAVYPKEFVNFHDGKKKILFVETHRRENLGEPMRNICRALKRIVDKYEDIEIVFSVHRNPAVREVVFPELSNIERVLLMDPVDYPVMIGLMKKSFFVLTDSGGLQEEAPSIGKPVVVLRENTERPEGLRAGTAVLSGTDENKIFELSSQLLEDNKVYEKMSKAINPYGDGKTSERIANILLNFKGIETRKIEEFAG